MSSLDDYYRARYEFPICGVCGDTLQLNRVMVYRLELFCGNYGCDEFAKTFWAWKEDLDGRD